MSNVCVLLADGFEEIEATTLIDVLRRAGVQVATLGVAGLEVAGAHGIKVLADAPLAEMADKPWDMVVLPGGLPGANTLRDTAAVQDLIRRQCGEGRQVAAICAAPIALGKAGVLDGKRATCYPGFESELTGASLAEERVVADGNIVTSRGPGTAMELALSLVERLVDERTAKELRTQLLLD